MFDAQEVRSPAFRAEGVAGVGVPPLTGGQSIHLLDRLTAVFKHRRVAGSAFALVVSLMMLKSCSTIPQYATVAKIEIQNPRSVQVTAAAAQDEYFEDSEIYYATQVQILHSRELARRVVQRLELHNHPDFNGTRPRPRDPLSLLRDARANASRTIRSVIARPGSGAPGTPASGGAEASARDSALISAFLPGLSVGQQRLTSIFEIRYQHTNPELAVMAANAVAEEYIKQNVEVRFSDTTKRLQFVTEELLKAQERVRTAEQDMTRYREEQNALSLQDRTNIVESGLNGAAAQVTKAQAQRKQREIVWNQLRSVDPSSDAADAHPAIGTSTAVVSARARLQQLEEQRGVLAQRGTGPAHPEMVRLKNEIALQGALLVAERRKVIEGVRSDYDAALEEERSFANALGVAKSASMDLSRKAGEYKILEDKANNERASLKSLLEERNRLDVVASSRANNARMVDRAELPRTPFSPDSRRDLLIALLAGLTAAVGLAFGIEYLDDSVKTPEDVTKRLNLPLLGLVPSVKGDRVPILSEPVPHDFGEAFRSLRTSLVFTSGDEPTRVIAVTSSQPLEGKTTTAANVAFALALGGSRVLLIDADMRRPGLHKTLGMENGVGLSHLLSGQAGLEDAIRASTEPHLSVITAGITPPNPSELLASKRMTELVSQLAAGMFEWVIIDTPPVLAVTDAVIIAQRVAALVFVVGSEMTRRVHVERALETLEAGKVKSIGAVLNRVDFDRNKYYYSRYYGYQYKSYYGQNTVA